MMLSPIRIAKRDDPVGFAIATRGSFPWIPRPAVSTVGEPPERGRRREATHEESATRRRDGE